MNFYKKFTKNLLENQPLLWHSKFFQLLFASICCNLVAFLAGFAMMNFDFLIKHGVTDFFFDSQFIYFYVILVIVVLALWGLTYFKNNAVKNFYPTSNFYFIKLFFLLYIPFLIFLCGKISFDYGTMLKGTSYMTEAELRTEKNKANMAYPFLGSNVSEYSFEKRTYPKEYKDVLYHSFLEDGNTENGNNSPIYYQSLQNKTTFNKIFTSTNFSFPMGKSKYLAYKQHPSEDTCDGNFIIDSFINVSKWSSFGDGKVENFSINLINNDYISHRESGDIYYESRNDYDSLYAPRVADWVLQNKKDSIISALQDIKLLCKKYGIKHVFNPSEVHDELAKNNFIVTKDIVPQFRPDYTESYSNSSYDYAETAVATATTDITEAEVVSEEDNEKIPDVFIDRDELKYRMDRLSDAYTMKFFESFLGIIVFAFGFTVFVLAFEFVDRIKFLISIPVTGVIMLASVFFGIGMYSMLDGVVENESIIGLITALIVFVLVYLGAFLGLFRDFLPKKVTSIFFYMAYFSSPFILNFVYGLISQLSKYEVKRCLLSSYDQYSIPFDFYVALLIAVLSFFIFTLFIKKYLAKEE